MSDQMLVWVVIAMFLASAVGLFFAFPSGNGGRVTKRVSAISKAGQSRAARATSPDQSRDRRKQVQQTLKELEERQKAEKKKMTLRRRLEMAGLSISTKMFFILSFVCAIFGFLAALLSGQTPVIAGLIAFVSGLGLPRWILGSLIKRRQKKFIEEFATSIDVIVRGVKSGLPVNECMQIIAREAASPVREEFQDLVEAQRIGIPLSQALQRMYDSMPLAEVNFFSIVLVLQQQTGGNLSEALGNLSEVLRGRRRMKGKIDAMSSEAKASAMIIGSLPFVVAGLLFLISRDYIMLMFTSQLGNLLLMGACTWMSIGILVMRAMINFKV